MSSKSMFTNLKSIVKGLAQVREGSNSVSSQDDNASISSQLAVPGIDLPQTEGFICPTCMNSYSTPENLQEHYQSQHVVTSYLCPVCKESFDSAVILDKHFESEHAVKKSHSQDTKDFQILQNELVDLNASLREEKWYSEEQGREIERLQSLLEANGVENSDPIKGQLSSMEAAKNSLVSEVMLLKRQLTEALENAASLKREKAEDVKYNALESTDNEDSTQILQKIMEESEEMRCKYENLKIDHENQISILNDQLTMYRKQNDTNKAREESLSAEIEMLKMEIKEQSEEMQSKKQKEIEYMQQNEELSIKAKNSAILIQSVQEDADKKEIEVVHLEQLYLESKRLLEEKNKASEDLITKFQETEGSLLKEREEKECLEERVQHISQELIEARLTVTRLESERKELLSQIQDGEGASTAIQQLQQESVVFQHQLAELRDASTHQLQEVQKKLQETQKMVYDSKHELKNVIQEKSRQEQLLTEAHEEIKLEKLKNENVSNELQKQVSLCQDQIQKLEEVTQEKLKAENDFKSLSVNCAQIEEEKKSAISELSTLKDEIQSLKYEIRRLQDQMLFKDQVGKKAEDDIKQLKKETEALTGEIKRVKQEYNLKEKECMNMKVTLEETENNLSLKINQNTKLETVINDKCAEIQLLMGDLKDKEKEIKSDKAEIDTVRKENELVRNEVEEKDLENKMLRNDVETLNKELSCKSDEVQKRMLVLIDLENDILFLRKEIENKDLELKQFESRKNGLIAELEATKKTKDDLELSVQNLSQANDKLEDSLQMLKSEKESLESYISEIKDQNKEIEDRWKQNQVDLEESVSAVKNEAYKAQIELKFIEEQFQREKEENLLLLKNLQADLSLTKDALDSSNQKLKVVMTNLAEIQGKLDQTEGQKIELELMVLSGGEERKALLDRILSAEDELEKMNSLFSENKKKLDDSQGALHELGRENQLLKMENSKFTGRKWADDKETTHCLNCRKEFTLTLRKHHCRNCGQIFCAECSSKAAQVPSVKGKARVCDVCYDDLGSR